MELHLNSSDESTITKDGSNVSQWSDKSGNGNHAVAFDNNRPTLVENLQNGKNGIVLNGVDEHFDINFGVSQRLGTMFIVASHDVGSIRSYATLLGGGRVSEVMIANSTTSNFYVSNGNSYYTNPNAGIRKNRTTTNNFAPLGTTHVFSANPETQPLMKSFTTFQIGKQRLSSWERHWKGSIFEILIYDRILSERKRVDVESYLGIKWGIETL